MENRDEAIKLMVWGVYIWGAMYAAFVMVSALTMHDRFAGMAIVATAGLAYLSQMLSSTSLTTSNRACGLASFGFALAAIGAGILAGVHLAFGG